jgi:hypothetical protein
VLRRSPRHELDVRSVHGSSVDGPPIGRPSHSRDLPCNRQPSTDEPTDYDGDHLSPHKSHLGN